MKTKEKALKWYNGLGKEVREELSLNYFGAILLTDIEIAEMYFEEVPHFEKERVVTLFYKYNQDRIEEELKRISEDIDILDSFTIDEWIKNNLL